MQQQVALEAEQSELRAAFCCPKRWLNSLDHSASPNPHFVSPISKPALVAKPGLLCPQLSPVGQAPPCEVKVGDVSLGCRQPEWEAQVGHSGGVHGRAAGVTGAGLCCVGRGGSLRYAAAGPRNRDKGLPWRPGTSYLSSAPGLLSPRHTQQPIGAQDRCLLEGY